MDTQSPSSIVDAPNAGRRPRPWLAGLLTVVGYGVGHAYSGRWLRGIACLVLALATQLGLFAILLRSDLERGPLVAIVGGVPIATLALSIADAVRTARRAPPRRTPWWLRTFLVLVAASTAFVVSIALCLVLMSRVVSAYRIPTDSMEPTLASGDRFLVDRTAYDGPFGRAPARGDVVIYRAPNDRERIFVKRIVAIAGDQVERSHGQLLVNHEPVAEARDPSAMAPLDFPLVDVHAGGYFVLGDNRAHSLDSSRAEHGNVPRADLLGRVVLVSYSSTDDGVRWDRVATRVR